MYCKYCGNELTDDAKFCSKCGKIVESAGEKKDDFFQNANDYTVERQYSPVEEKQKRSLGQKILTYAILGLSFGWTGFLSLFGVIFAGKAKKKIKEYIALYGETEGPATVGKSLNIPGMIISWIGFIIILLYIVAIIFMVCLGLESEIGDYYYYFDTYSSFFRNFL
jgi:hypothetical protein